MTPQRCGEAPVGRSAESLKAHRPTAGGRVTVRRLDVARPPSLHVRRVRPAPDGGCDEEATHLDPPARNVP
ncbi:hypothetical protein OHA77_19545 [Streptosporangium sp. NBC_01639]|uniref:hypothetical protein n=1 Tax=Streptosporangium sp. NBC_01639 TaxID=2975948 RepID=UPI0038704CD7|nr:hypothetical protein OHA77_19545 [Streptosporangium sp. NBC_01639]